MSDPHNGLLWLWPITGWVCGLIAAPRAWWRTELIFGFILIFICGAIAGPIGLFWVWLDRKYLDDNH